jgi:predicted alpha/beta superfamily hydrolase
MRVFAIIGTFLLTFYHCFSQPPNAAEYKQASVTRIYSKQVRDTFSIHVKLPKEHATEKNRRFTTIYLLDANMYFDIVAAMVEKYQEIGIMPPVILIGVGYKNFELMEELRTRDYLYPKALNKDKINKSGGGLDFLSFLENELIPSVDSLYRTKAENRILMGHSYGGYFCLMAFLKNMQEKDNVYRSYIAASPSLQYHDEYLLQHLKTISSDFTVPKLVYTSLGELEDKEDGKQKRYISSMYQSFNDAMKAKKFKNVIYQADNYSNFYHMETAIAGFMKGLLFIYRDNP